MTPGLRASAAALLARDLRLVWRRRGDSLQPALFALLVVMLFALAAGSEREVLARHAAPVLWLAVLLLSSCNLLIRFSWQAVCNAEHSGLCARISI